MARLGHVSRARVTQIMNLLCLAPDLQEMLLFLPRTEHGRDPIILRNLQPIATALAWRDQRWLWAQQQPDTVAASTTNPGRRNPRKKDKSRRKGA